MGFKIIVEGDYACYTRPELKVERVSYDVPVPGAMEGMIKKVYWKPPIRYVIDKIVVFNPIEYTNIRRNEVKDKVSPSILKSQIKLLSEAAKQSETGVVVQDILGTSKASMKEGTVAGKNCQLFVDDTDVRTQRASMLLKNVRYGVEFHFELTHLKCDHADECEEKHYNILRRRLLKGQHHSQPTLGCREFGVRSIELVDDFDYTQVSEELKGDVDLGWMLYRVNFADGGKPVNGDWENPIFSDKAEASYYHPHMIDGVIDVKKYAKGVVNGNQGTV